MNDRDVWESNPSFHAPGLDVSWSSSTGYIYARYIGVCVCMHVSINYIYVYREIYFEIVKRPLLYVCITLFCNDI